MHYVGRRVSETNPLRSIPLFTSPRTIFGPTPLEIATAALTSARQGVENRQAWVAHFCGALGKANRLRGPMRRYWQAKAFRGINLYRKELRQARRNLAAAEAALLAFAPAQVA